MSQPDALLKIGSLSKHFGGFTALDQVSVDVGRGERFGLIGPNGSGKTTLINCISGALQNDQGSILFDGAEISRMPAYKRTRLGIARSFQIPRPFGSMSVLENLIVPLEYVAHSGSLHLSDPRGEAMEILKGMGLADKADTLSSSLSQVELRKMELARAMAARPRLLISDEAMAGLETERRVQRSLARLEPDAREVLVLRDIEGLSYAEIVDITGLAEGTVKSRLHRARVALKAAFEAEGGSTR